MRAAFAENAQLDVGKRTKKAAELVKAQILALAPELDADRLAKKALENAGIKSDDKGTKALFFMSAAQAKALAELAVEGFADKKLYMECAILPVTCPESGALDGHGAVWPHGGR